MPDPEVEAFFADSPSPARAIREDVKRFIAAQKLREGPRLRSHDCSMLLGFALPLGLQALMSMDRQWHLQSVRQIDRWLWETRRLCDIGWDHCTP